MPTFKFEAMDTTGGEVKDQLEATNEEEAQQKIRQMGYFVTKLTEMVAKGKKGDKTSTAATTKSPAPAKTGDKAADGNKVVTVNPQGGSTTQVAPAPTPAPAP